MNKDHSQRTRNLLDYDNALRSGLTGHLCGVDEAGRGPIAGPVVAAAVIFGDDVYIEDVFDSKQVTGKRRNKLYEEILARALSYGLGIVENGEIDELNILNATKKAMSLAIGKLIETPSLVIVDGNFYSNTVVALKNVIKADEKSFSVAAASILAKVTRDRIMCEYQSVYPNFSFSHHKGYGTTAHIDEILEYGYTDIHRKTFKLKAVQGVLF